MLKEKTGIKRLWNQTNDKPKQKTLYRLLFGTTSDSIRSLTTGTHEVEISKDQYGVWNENVDVEAGEGNFLTAIPQKNAGSISIKSEPATAKIYLDGNDISYTPDIIRDISPGTHEVEIRLDGYDFWSKKVSVKAGERIVLNAILKNSFGSISINSDPSIAKIYLDGYASSTHEVEISKDQYEVWNENVDVEVGEENLLTTILQKSAGSISIKSEPLSAKIYVDGNAIGITPDSIRNVAPGIHEVEISLDGYEVWSKNVSVKAGEEEVLNSILQKSVGSIRIKSEPSTAKIFLDGNAIGITPDSIRNVAPGIHDVKICLDGYKVWSKKVSVKVGEEVVLNAILQKSAGSIRIKSEPSMAKIYLDGDAIGITPERIIDLKPDIYTVKIIKEGYKTCEEVVSVKLGNEILISTMLEKELVRLRSTYDKLSVSQVHSLQRISIRETNKLIFLCHSTINHDYEQKTINEDKVIIDHATELMWHQSGSKEYFNLRKAIKWIKMVNKKCYAGYNDWRLPTLEEAASLLDLNIKKGNFVDPVFDKRQWGAWTGDKCDCGNAWIVTFVNGTVSQSLVGMASTFVRPVRSLVCT